MDKKILFFILFLFLFLPVVNANENVTSDNSTISDFNAPVSSIGADDNVSLTVENNETISQASTNKTAVLSSANQIVSKISAKDVTTTYSKKTKFSVAVYNEQGKIMKNQTVKFKVNDKVYTKFTDSKGIATIYLNLNAGNYVVYYSAGNISGKKKFIVKNYYVIGIYKWNSGADVTKNRKIKDNVPDSALVKKMIVGAKSGTPVIKFKGGNGKVVFISAGVHGNELSSQVAAMKLIQYLETHPIKGTVYVMPFMNPKGTASNVRDYNGVKLNSKANVKGTISYNTVSLIIKYKCDFYGDFHCTQPGGDPGADVAMGTYSPTAKSADMAKYIAKKSNVKYLIYKKAGAEYPGALEDVVNLKGIPAVTCEVLTPHGTMVVEVFQNRYL